MAPSLLPGEAFTDFTCIFKNSHLMLNTTSIIAILVHMVIFHIYTLQSVIL